VIDLSRVETAVDIGDPGHLPLTRAHVGRWHVDARPDVALFHELGGEPTGDPLDLPHRVLLWIDYQPALRAAVGDVNDGAFIGHERGQRLDFVLVDPRSEPDPALDRQAVIAVHRAPSGKDLVVPVVELHREAHLQHRVAGNDRLWYPLRELHVGEGGSNHRLDAF
jgi:hypothetical protein